MKVQSDTPTVLSSSGIEVQVFKNDPIGFDDVEISTGSGSIKIPRLFGSSQDTPILMEVGRVFPQAVLFLGFLRQAHSCVTPRQNKCFQGILESVSVCQPVGPFLSPFVCLSICLSV